MDMTSAADGLLNYGPQTPSHLQRLFNKSVLFAGCELISVDMICKMCFSQVSVFDGTKEKCKRVSTSGVDGSLIIWDLNVSVTHLP